MLKHSASGPEIRVVDVSDVALFGLSSRDWPWMLCLITRMCRRGYPMSQHVCMVCMISWMSRRGYPMLHHSASGPEIKLPGRISAGF